MAKKTKTKKGGGLSVPVQGGLNKKNYTKKAGGVDRIQLDKGKTVTVQFLFPINDTDNWKEIDQHQFQERNRWNYVPCLGDDCPLCADDDRDVAKTTYRFLTNAYDLENKRIAVLEGPKDLSGRIAARFTTLAKKKKSKLFTKKTYDISKMDTTPVSYDVETSDDDPVPEKRIDLKKCIDLDAYILEQAKRYFGDDMPSSGKSSKRSAMDDEDDEEYEEDEYDEDDLEEMDKSELRKIAKAIGAKTKDKEGEPLSKSKLIKSIIKKQG